MLSDIGRRLGADADTSAYAEAGQTGGKIIGEGAYGCAFDASLKCKPGTTKRIDSPSNEPLIGKLALKTQALVEIKQSNILKVIPNAKDYFTVIEYECDLAPRKSQKEKDMDKCGVLEEKPYDKFIQLLMPYNGKSLASLKKAIDTRVIHFYEFGRHLLEAGTLLLTHGIIHYDLHTGNVLVKTPDRPIVIDFGLSWQEHTLTKKIADKHAAAGYDPKYGQYSPELSIPEAAMEGLKLNNTLYNDIIGKKGVHELLEKIYGIPSQKAVEGLADFVADSKSVEKGDWLAFNKTYWPKFDAWAIGRILLRLYSLIVYDRAFKDDARAYMYKTVLVGLLEANPRRRLNAAQALRLWAPESALLKTESARKWTS
jgi:hypothetical protein